MLTGPAGSGKTTTIYACLHQLAELGGRHIITVEDPVEQLVPGVQTEINEAIGLDFARAASSCCGRTRRCSSSARFATKPPRNSARIRAGLTGHLVISTPARAARARVFERLLAMCARSFRRRASSVELVLKPAPHPQGLFQLRWQRLCNVSAHGLSRPCAADRMAARGRQLSEQIRRRELSAILPTQTLETSARSLMNEGVTNEAEFKLSFGLYEKKHIGLALRRSVPVLGRSNIQIAGDLRICKTIWCFHVAAPGDGHTPPENCFREL